MSELGQGEKYGLRGQDLKDRTKIFAVRVIKLVQALPQDRVSKIIGGQILRSGTSVGANYRTACRVRTAKEFVAKIRIVVEEADETQFWLELLESAETFKSKRLGPLYEEATELVAIFTASLRTARLKIKKSEH